MVPVHHGRPPAPRAPRQRSSPRVGLAVGLLLAAAHAAAGTDDRRGRAVVATFNDGEARREITRDLYQDYLAYHEIEAGPVERSRLESLALLLRLEAEALRAEPAPRLALEVRIAEERLLSAHWRRQAMADLSVSQAAVEARLDELRRQGAMRRPRKLHLSELFKRLPATADAGARARLRSEIEALRRRLLEGEDFATLARAESDSQNAAHGGRLGVVRPGVLPEPLEKIAYGLRQGELSEVLESPAGFVILRCDKIVEARDTPEAEARRKIRDQLERRAAEEHWQRLRAGALRAAKPAIDLAAARGEAPDAVALRFGAHRLDAREVAWLTRAAPGAPAVSSLSDERLRRLLEDHVVRAVLAERARRRPLAPDLERRLRWRRASAYADAGLRRRVQALFEPPNEEELRAYVAAHPERFTRRMHYRLRVLRADVDPAAPRRAGRLIAEVSRRVETGELTFEDAARRHSDHWSAAEGGDVGWWSRQRLAAHGLRLLRAVSGLEPGATSQAVRQDRSWWLLRLLETEPPRPMTFAEARRRADHMLGNERLRALQARVEREILGQLELIAGGEPG